MPRIPAVTPFFKSGMKQKQTEGVNFILDVWEAEHANKDGRWLAYVLATTFHETSKMMQPIKEMGGTGWPRMKNHFMQQ